MANKQRTYAIRNDAKLFHSLQEFDRRWVSFESQYIREQVRDYKRA